MGASISLSACPPPRLTREYNEGRKAQLKERAAGRLTSEAAPVAAGAAATEAGSPS